MNKSPIEILRDGRIVLDQVMNKYGFAFEDGPSGKSSGGPSASGTYVNKDRKLEVHFRYPLGLLTYHFGTVSIEHESYVHALLGNEGGNKYPGFADSPSVQFEDLARDLQHFAASFLDGDFESFSQIAKTAAQRKKISGFARQAQSES